MADQADPEQEIEALIHPGDDGKFWAEVIGLAGCYTQGDNYSTILARLRDAHELCRHAARSAQPKASAVTLEENPTIGHLTSALTADGWSAIPSTSESHTLLEQTATSAILCLPSEPDEPLCSGLRQALKKYLGGG